MKTAEQLQQAAARGALLLDAKFPGWVEKIHQDQLLMRSCSHCVVTQSLGDYSKGLKQLGVEGEIPQDPREEYLPFHFGFDTPWGDNEATTQAAWHELEQAWRALIQERLDAKQGKEPPQ